MTLKNGLYVCLKYPLNSVAVNHTAASENKNDRLATENFSLRCTHSGYIAIAAARKAVAGRPDEFSPRIIPEITPQIVERLSTKFIHIAKPMMSVCVSIDSCNATLS